jgi:alpha-aminoadipate carrier protein LysW
MVMALCPECEAPLDVAEDEVDEGEVVVCDECGSEFEVVTSEPFELAKVEEGYVDETVADEFQEEDGE